MGTKRIAALSLAFQMLVSPPTLKFAARPLIMSPPTKKSASRELRADQEHAGLNWTFTSITHALAC
eukprot:5708003-Pleurochrysis_carterae.AAC.1